MSVYDDRPWLATYPEGWPADLEPEVPTMLDAFRASVARRPDGVFLRYFDAPLSFREVDDLTDAYAVALAEGGVGRGDRIVVHLQNVPQFTLTMLAAWKIGAILVSANPMYRARELRTIVEDARAVALVALESLYDEVGREAVEGTTVARVITTSPLDWLGDDAAAVPAPLAGVERARHAGTEDLRELLERHAAARPAPGASEPADLALLTYTSGTTGPPKGALNTHANIAFSTHLYRDLTGVRDDDVILGIGPLFHVTGLIAHQTLAMLAGIPLILAHRFDAQETLRLVERHRATFTVAAFTAYVALMNAPGAGERDLSSLRRTLSGGAAISPAVARRWRERMGTRIVPVYGLTETSGPTHIGPPDRDPPVDPAFGALAVGLPTPGTMARILDEEGRELPAGEVGEIVVAGPQVVAGYWEKPEESAVVFAGGQMRTGDIGVMDDEGWFYVVDRKKDLINASGFKVWPREVEEVLLAHDAVREAAVVGVPDEYRGETVQAYVSLKPGAAATVEELVGFCRPRMAAYKSPRTIEIVDELPKNASGKILRRELRDAAARA